MPEELVLDRLQANLDRLRLPRARTVLLDVARTAQAESYSYLQMLDTLLEEEVACKEQRRLDTAFKVSGLPFIKTLDDFDFGFQPGLDRQQIASLFDLAFLARHDNVLFLGPPGVGKTHLAVALAVKCCQAGQTIYYTTMADLVEKLKADHDAGKTGRTRCHLRASLVVVDEVGYTPIGRDECHLFYRFVAARYEKASTVITSNKAFGVRRDVAWMIVTRDRPRRDRVSHHPYPTRTCGAAMRGLEPSDNVSCRRESGAQNREARASLPASGGKGLGWTAWSAYAIPR